MRDMLFFAAGLKVWNLRRYGHRDLEFIAPLDPGMNIKTGGNGVCGLYENEIDYIPTAVTSGVLHTTELKNRKK